jgi:hypothetical protein
VTEPDRPKGGYAPASGTPFLSLRPERIRPRLELVSVAGHPTLSEEKAIQKAVEEAVIAERRERAGSLWMRAGRSQGRRLGMSDYRDRFDKEDAWRLSARFPYGGREYPGLVGRGDAR